MRSTRDHERVHTRKIDRSVAHTNMQKEGIEHINKSSRTTYVTPTGAMKIVVEPSFFAKNWRSYSS